MLKILQAMKKWEYKVETVYADGSAIDINALGEQGWELCTIVNFSLTGRLIFYFKRPKEYEKIF